MDSAEILAQNIDKSQVPPLHQKRILAFVNHFLISSCSFLNEFAFKCESRFIEIERKMQKVEAALTIIEAKLASIPDEAEAANATPAKSVEKTETTEAAAPANSTSGDAETPPPAEPVGVKACEDARYRKFFKMVQVGVPAPAVKLKMQADGMDPNVLDNPNQFLPDGIR